MNQTILASIFRSLVTVAGVAATTTGVATSGEVSSITTNVTTAFGAIATLISVGWGIYSRTAPQLVKATNKLPNIVQPAIVKK